MSMDDEMANTLAIGLTIFFSAPPDGVSEEYTAGYHDGIYRALDLVQRLYKSQRNREVTEC